MKVISLNDYVLIKKVNDFGESKIFYSRSLLKGANMAKVVFDFKCGSVNLPKDSIIVFKKGSEKLVGIFDKEYFYIKLKNVICVVHHE